jgi:hypothetical protein
MLLARHGWDIHAIEARSEHPSLITLVHQERRNTKDQGLDTRHPPAQDQLQLDGHCVRARRGTDTPIGGVADEDQQARIKQQGRSGSAQATHRKQRSLGSERGLATPSPDGKGEITLGPSMKIMPLDPYSTLGRSCEPAYQVDFAGTGAARRRSRAGGRLVRPGRPRGELLAHLAAKLTRAPGATAGRGALSTCDQFWITHHATLP